MRTEHPLSVLLLTTFAALGRKLLVVEVRFMRHNLKSLLGIAIGTMTGFESERRYWSRIIRELV